MHLTVNGQPTDLPDGATVADLLAQMGVHPMRCAVERNKQLIRRADHPDTVLAEGDSVEVVTLAGGG